MDHLGMHGIRYSDAESGNQVQYEFYRTHRDRYDDGGFLQYVNDKIGGSHGVQNSFISTPDHHREKWAAAQAWYERGTRRAQAAFRTLLDAYGEQTCAITTDPGGEVWQHDTYDPAGTGGDGSYGGGGFGGPGYGGFDGSAGPSIGTPPPPAAGWSGTSNASEFNPPPGARAADGSSDPSAWDEPAGSTLAGGIGPAGGGGGLGGGPGSTGGGGAGTGGFGGVSGGYGAGTGGYGPETGSGAPVMPPASPAAGRSGGVAAGRGGGAGSGRSNTYGAVPHGAGSGGSKERDERYSWLTEDDEDIWKPKYIGPETNSAGAIE